MDRAKIRFEIEIENYDDIRFSNQVSDLMLAYFEYAKGAPKDGGWIDEAGRSVVITNINEFGNRVVGYVKWFRED